MTKKEWVYLLVAIVMLCSGRAVLAVEATPSIMNIIGTIQASAKVSPQPNDKILIINTKNGTLEDQGVVMDDGVSYVVTMSKADSFKGTSLTMRLQQSNGGAIYQLTDNNTPFSFNGGFVR
jgi:hypothetical protein